MNNKKNYSNSLIIESLKLQIAKQQKEIFRLQKLLDENKISYKIDDSAENFQENKNAVFENQLKKSEVSNEQIQHLQNINPAGQKINFVEPTRELVNLFYSYFKGRPDVYAKRGGRANSNGKVGYFVQCWNFWKNELCIKKIDKSKKCSDCPNRKYKELQGRVLLEHLKGEKQDCSDVIALYPAFADETCNFLVFDFDNHFEEIPKNVENKKTSESENNFYSTQKELIEDVISFRTICEQNDIPFLVERSRSGNGFHIWIFFNAPISILTARKFGSLLLTHGAESVSQKNFKTYDRMIPSQDYIKNGELGNLIALPLQGQALKNANSAFVDKDFCAYENQWEILKSTKKLSAHFVEEKIFEWSKEGLFGTLSENFAKKLYLENDDESENKNSKIKKFPQINKPWQQAEKLFSKTDVDGILKITLASQIFIEKHNLQPRIQNQIRRFAAFSNSEFYKKQAMGFSTKNIARIVFSGSDTEEYIVIPRGLKNDFIQLLKDSSISYEIFDERQKGKKINVSFTGELYPEQKIAVEKMLNSECGILSATTAFGKTVVGSYLIAEKKCNTLILVHNSEIMQNWILDFSKFLKVEEELPSYKTKNGKIKKRKSVIGQLYGGHNSITGIIDVAMISSLGKKDQINEIVKNYGMVLVDECHHIAAQTFDEVIREVNTNFIYGFTATPKREDKMEKKIFMQLGPILYKFTSKDRIKLQNINHFVYPRFTRVINTQSKKIKLNDAYSLLIENKKRNEQIVNDVLDCLKQNRTPLILTKQKRHLEILSKLLSDKADFVFLLHGGFPQNEKEKIREDLKNVPKEKSIILIATGQYIGEGFNFPRLDTMMLTMPISWEGNVEQYAGRINRDYENKNDVIIYDYIDINIPVLERMSHKRFNTYKKIGYEIFDKTQIEKNKEKSAIRKNMIFDNFDFLEEFKNDILNSKSEIIISSLIINLKSITNFINLISSQLEKNLKITVITLSAKTYSENAVLKIQQLQNKLSAFGVYVIEKECLYNHFAIFDKEIVWYGNINLLADAKQGENIMRLENCELADELVESEFLPKKLGL